MNITFSEEDKKALIEKKDEAVSQTEAVVKEKEEALEEVTTQLETKKAEVEEIKAIIFFRYLDQLTIFKVTAIFLNFWWIFNVS